MLNWWCLIWCTLARCSTGAPDTTTSSSPTSGARDTSGLKKTSRWRQQSFLIQPLRWKYYWNHKKIMIFFSIRVRREGDARQKRQLRLMPQQQQRPSQPRRFQQQQRSHSRTPCTTWWSRVWVIIIAENDKCFDFAFRVLFTSSDLIWRSKALTLLSFQFMTR